MNKIKFKFIILFLLLHWFFYPDSLFLKWNSDTEQEFLKLKNQYEWLDEDLYYFVNSFSNQYEVDRNIIFALIQAESSGRNIRGRRQNYNGTYDHGYMQINQVHLPRGADSSILYNPAINIKIGVRYFSFCYNRANNNLAEALRMYNQGHNSNRNNYRNWIYVGRILKMYKESRNEH